jgi:hypothetical protein
MKQNAGRDFRLSRVISSAGFNAQQLLSIRDPRLALDRDNRRGPTTYQRTTSPVGAKTALRPSTWLGCEQFVLQGSDGQSCVERHESAQHGENKRGEQAASDER